MFVKMSTAFSFSIVHIGIFILSIRCTSSAPTETLYSKFIQDMKINKCTSPEQIKLTNISPYGESYEYLSSYLKICQNPNTLQRKNEALYLCPELLENVKLILCPPISVKVIANARHFNLSNEVCDDIGALKDAVPENQVVLKRLTDKVNCDIMCDGIFVNACQVLLWSYQLQPQKGQTESSNKEVKENALQAEIKAVPGGQIESSNKEVKENVLQATEIKAVPDEETKPTDEKKMAVIEQQVQIPGETKQQSTNDLISTLQETVAVVKQQAQNPIPEQPSNPEPNAQSPPPTFPKSPISNILPMYQNNLVSNSTPDAGLPQVEINEVAEKDVAGLGEQEDPHDQAEPLAHNADAVDVNGQPPQNLDDKKPSGLSTAKESSNLPNNVSPDLPGNGEYHLQAKSPNPDEGFVEPHDEQEDLGGEMDRNETEPKVPVVVSETSKQQGDVGNPNLNIEADVKPVQDAATTKDGGTTKNEIATMNKKVVSDVKIPPVGETQGTVTQKTTGQDVPSQKESSASSVALPTSNKESSSTPKTELEKMDDDDVHEMPVDREPDQYTDLENTEGDPDDDYARQEYGKVYEPTKHREAFPDKPNEVEVSKINMRPREPSFDDLSLGEKYGRQSVFPEQEDGHFFFYFLTIVLVLMAGYLLFHNKQKIIALIVEGRHERRRRSHGVGYKKLETK